MDPEVVEHFFGVYLLYCKNPKYKGRTYIGYTVNPRRRIKQHNKGKNFGGAWRTSNRGPWEMVLIIHGFPNSTSALRFEWAWQHPELSRRLKHVPKKKNRQSTFEYRLVVLTEMLQVGPWSRLPLTIRWLDDDFAGSYSSHVNAPLHMPVTYGKVITKKPEGLTSASQTEEISVPEEAICFICSLLVESQDRLNCLKPGCPLIVHLICLAKSFTKGDGNLIPIEGDCPKCDTNLLWGDLIRKKIGCNMHLDEQGCDSDSSDD